MTVKRKINKTLGMHSYMINGMLWQKHTIKTIPEEVNQNTETKRDTQERDSVTPSRSFSSSDTCSTQISNPRVRRKKLNWVVNMIVETIQETVECEPVTIKIKKAKVRCGVAYC